MAELLKNIYNDSFFTRLCDALQQIIKDFDKKAFLKEIKNKHWENLELKQRMRHIAEVVYLHLKGDFKNKASQCVQLVECLQIKNKKEQSLEFMFIPQILELYGIEQADIVLNTFEKITEFCSCEFAVRPFYQKYPDKVLKKMFAFSKHKHEHVRRFASEGIRPRLPWGIALQQLKKDPSPILPILENLKNDNSLYVRKSVANCINDIAKDNPKIALALAKKWYGKQENTNWIVRHGLRGLLKKGDKEALELFGIKSTSKIKIEKTLLHQEKLRIGEHLEFSFCIAHNEKQNILLRLEYAIYYLKANGKHNKKVFKISESNYIPNTTHTISRKQSFKNMTTRKHYKGPHFIAIIINGEEKIKRSFELN
jgi:3-methyladenine DNA glycosylase AlkC